MNTHETGDKQQFGFTLSGTPQEQQTQMLQLILETALETKAKMDALIIHIHCELANYLHPDSMEDAQREAMRWAESFEKRWLHMTERTMGEIAARRD